jgi:hypothetical protein
MTAGFGFFFIIFGVNYCRYSWSAKSSRLMTIVFGIINMGVGLSLLFLASKYAPELYTAPLIAFMIPINFIVARNVNNEIVDNDSFMNGWFVAVGCFIAAAASSVCPSNDHSVVDEPGIIIWAVISGIAILNLLLFLVRAKILKHDRNMFQVVGRPVLSACLLANASLSTRAIVLHPEIFMLMLFTVVLALAGIIVLVFALSDTYALTVVPIWVATYMILDIMGGAVFFAEMHNFTSARIFFFLLAIVLIAVAITLQVSLEDFSPPGKAYIPRADLNTPPTDEESNLNGARSLDQ